MPIGTTTILQQTFKGLDAETLKALRIVAQRQHHPPGTVIFEQGDVGHSFYIVVEGHISVSQRLEDGEERLLGMIGANQYFGEMGLIDNSPRMATCTALTPVTLLEITEEVFDRLVEKSPIIAYDILRRILATARENDRLAIEELKAKNEALRQAYVDLQAAQAKLILKERLERELELAADVQRQLLPGELPQFPDYAFAAYLKPARQVGGDFYDVDVLDDEHVALLMADVADKGFHAALFMAVTRTLFLQEAKHSLSPAQVALAVHQGMLDVSTADDMFVTAFYGVLHRPSGCLTYVRAGQERPLLIRPGKGVEALDGGGRFLGMMESLELQEYVVKLEPGDRLVLFSDGVPDTVNQAGEHFGNSRLTAIVERAGHLSAPELAAQISTALAEWCQGAPPFDDVTLLVAEVRATDGALRL